MPKWDYLVLDYQTLAHDSEICASLNAWGQDGWELVAIAQDRDGEMCRYIFKRPQLEQP